jgi:hypothetical protein
MDTLILYHHLGLGDHMMCHGLVRETCKHHRKVIIFAKKHNIASVRFMFRDIRNLELIEGDDSVARSFIQKHPEMTLLPVGFGGLDWSSEDSLDVQFYGMGHVPIEAKFSEFKVKRDAQGEAAFFNELIDCNPEMRVLWGDYIFLHHDPERGMGIKLDRISSDLPVIQPNPKYTDCIFDYCKIIEKASEVHVIDSSFFHMIDCMSQYKGRLNQKLVIHRYARPHVSNSIEEPLRQKDWEILV